MDLTDLINLIDLIDLIDLVVLIDLADENSTKTKKTLIWVNLKYDYYRNLKGLFQPGKTFLYTA